MRRDKLYLADIVEATDAVAAFLAGAERERFLTPLLAPLRSPSEKQFPISSSNRPARASVEATDMRRISVSAARPVVSSNRCPWSAAANSSCKAAAPSTRRNGCSGGIRNCIT